MGEAPQRDRQQDRSGRNLQTMNGSSNIRVRRRHPEFSSDNHKLADNEWGVRTQGSGDAARRSVQTTTNNFLFSCSILSSTTYHLRYGALLAVDGQDSTGNDLPDTVWSCHGASGVSATS